MNAQCPISGAFTGIKQSRLNGLFTVLALGLFFVYPHPAIPLFLTFDFLLRAFSLKLKSPVTFVSERIVRGLNLTETMTDAAPKRFAARLGLIFSLLILGLALAGRTSYAFALAGMFGLCAALEAFFGYCVGCKIYSLRLRA